MKTASRILGLFLCIALLAGCAGPAQTGTDAPGENSSVPSAQSISTQEPPAQDAPPSETGAPGASGASDGSGASGTSGASGEKAASGEAAAALDTPSVSSAPAAQPAPELQFYDSFRDIPFVDLEYGTYWENGEINKNSLDKNGEPWCAAPGMMGFGERCFTDGTTLWIQTYIPGEGFDWFKICFDHVSYEEPIWTTITEVTGDPPRTVAHHPLINKIFTHADGYTVYTDDGYSYTVEPCIFAAD